MKRYRRAGVVGAASCALLLVGTAPAVAQSWSVSVYNNGLLKATASYNQTGWWLCANLHAGYSATAIMDGNSITDYTDNGSAHCIQIFSPNEGQQYLLKVQWRGTGGAFKENQTVVIAA